MADTAKPARKASPIKTAYLILYNAASAILWFSVLANVINVNVSAGTPKPVYPAIGQFTKWTQTLAGMEVLHSLLGTLSTIPHTSP